MLTPDDVEDYRAAIDYALEHQDNWGGLTADKLAERGVGMEIFTVAALKDANQG